MGIHHGNNMNFEDGASASFDLPQHIGHIDVGWNLRESNLSRRMLNVREGK